MPLGRAFRFLRIGLKSASIFNNRVLITKVVCLCVMALPFSLEVARADVFNATGEGWCELGGPCDNTSNTSLANTFAGSFGGIYDDWLAFSLPNLGTPITSATLSIFNSGSDFTQNPGAIYNLYGASGISFASLATGPILGSDPLATADNGVDHYESISLNAAGLALLNANQGGLVLFGGDVAGASSASDVQIFGYTNGTPQAMLLTVETAAAVPEPRSVAVLVLFFLLTVIIHRKKCAFSRAAARLLKVPFVPVAD